MIIERRAPHSNEVHVSDGVAQCLRAGTCRYKGLHYVPLLDRVMAGEGDTARRLQDLGVFCDE